MTLWGSHFEDNLNQAAWELNESLSFDKRMADQDVRGSMAWANAITEAGVLIFDENTKIQSGLIQIQKELSENNFEFSPLDEDIHTAVERRLGEIIGDLAGKLHTGRSRNDQVATDFRLWLLDNLPGIQSGLQLLQKTLIERAENDIQIIMPGYTHLQRAQPILLSHWWLSFFWPLQRDMQRLSQLIERISICPLGSAALAGTTFPVDRDQIAKELGFDSISQNSLDAVSNRDFAAEFLFLSSMIAVHLSKLSESVILFSSAEFGFFEVADAFSTGSSLMPQKRNPDLFELARGKSGTMIGILTGFLTTLKGLPSTYDKDLQEDKIAVFKAFDMLQLMLPILAEAVKTITVNDKKMLQAVDSGLMATDIADYLVKKGLPFRQAYAVTGKAVRKASQKNISLKQLPFQDWKNFSELINNDIYSIFDPKNSINQRNIPGGTAESAVLEQIKLANLEVTQKQTRS